MIVLEERRLVILTPPHTASGTLHRVFRHWGGHHVVGPTPDGAGYDHHTTVDANGWVDFETAVVVRHPWARLTGLWQHHCWWTSTVREPELSLEEFVRFVSRDDGEVLSWFYRWPIGRWLGTRRHTHVVQLERIEEQLSQILRAPFRMPPAIETHAPWQWSWCDSYRSQLQSWLASEDCFQIYANST